MYKHLFGPVPSRRLGMSLGVDLVPSKVCTLDCVYCEAGRTTDLTLERKEYISFDKVAAELDHYFRNNPDPDYITFSGSGEPTLNCRLGDVIEFIRQRKPAIPVAVLTNGTLLHDEGLRRELAGADLVLPSLDAALKKAFIKINRPCPGLDIEKYIKGLIEFSKQFSGRIWLEVFILPGYNDSAGDLDQLNRIIMRINPESVQLNTLDRPGTIAGLKSADRTELMKIRQTLDFDRVEIIASARERKNSPSYRTDIHQAILGTISRRPCTLEDLEKILGMHGAQINKYLDVLEAENRIESVREQRGIFYQIKKSSAGSSVPAAE